MDDRVATLKLIALDREGLEVISAHTQNTCVKRSDMAWLPRQHRFVVAGMRYDWVGAKTGPAERVASILRFDRVLKVSHLGLEHLDSEATLNLLAVTFEKTDPPAGMIILAFADASWCASRSNASRSSCATWGCACRRRPVPATP